MKGWVRTAKRARLTKGRERIERLARAAIRGVALGRYTRILVTFLSVSRKAFLTRRNWSGDVTRRRKGK